MYKQNGVYQFSPSDLTQFLNSPFAAWVDRFALECPDLAPEKDPADPLLKTLQKKGFLHEDRLETSFVEQGLSLVNIAGDSREEKTSKTLEAMSDGIQVIVQARLEKEQFGGYADFLVRVSGASSLGDYHYEVWDTKLAHRVKPSFVIQLCCYAEMLEQVQGLQPTYIIVALGNNKNLKLRTKNYFHYYLQVKNNFLEAQEGFNAKQVPDPADSASWGDWSGYANELLTEKDHLLQVANITRGQIKKLGKAGINTVAGLASTRKRSVPGLNPGVLSRLKKQASLQISSRQKERPDYEIILPEGEPSGLALLPPASSADLFFDIEGFPLHDGGLEYLWGCTFFNKKGEREFKDFWAHDSDQEKKAFAAFIHWAYRIWKRNPKMHIYHYGHYEVTVCRRLMGRYGCCEQEVDQLLRNEVFVDLYKIVKGGLLLGESGYSIKNVEHLYRPRRDTAVGSGDVSIVAYESWQESRSAGHEGASWQTSATLKAIRDYNLDDCNSTQELAAWLHQQQQHYSIDYLGHEELVEPEINEEITARTKLRDELLMKAEQQKTEQPDAWAITEHLAWTLEFHRREAKPLFWRLFDRLGLSDEELADDMDCLAGCQRTSTAPLLPNEGARNLAYEYKFDPAQEFKAAKKQFYLLGVKNEEERPVTVTYVPEHSDMEKGLIVVQAEYEPPHEISLIPNEYVNPKPIPAALDAVIGDYYSGNLQRCAIIDFLRRSNPVISGHKGGPIAPASDPQKKLKQVVKAVKNLDASYLAIQGPPGTGKSYTAKHVIAELLKKDAKVGITSNSHKAINHLLLTTAVYCKQQGIKGTFVCTKDTGPEIKAAGIKCSTNNRLHEVAEPPYVIGATAWGFSRGDMMGTLDYLFVDEAGQVSVANLIAMSRSTRNLVLLGDQMQLGQPTQGTHPGTSGLSILDYLLQDTPTMPEDMGVFLGTTYRMHPEVNRFISDYVYEGKLNPHAGTGQRFIEVPKGYRGPLNKEAGILYVPVEHVGNTQGSDEEVDTIKELADALLNRTFVDVTGNSRPITWDDILFVAPYNLQVMKLQMALGKNARVGSVDKFQGQEAPIVFLSMCASDANESPRGIDFLFNKNRINVAISRAKCLAVVVANPALRNTKVNRVEQLELVSLFNALCDASTLS